MPSVVYRCSCCHCLEPTRRRIFGCSLPRIAPERQRTMAITRRGFHAPSRGAGAWLRMEKSDHLGRSVRSALVGERSVRTTSRPCRLIGAPVGTTGFSSLANTADKVLAATRLGLSVARHLHPRKKRGRPLVGPCQASKQSHGGASRQFFQLLHTSLAIADRTRFFKVWLRTNRASHPSGSSDQRWSAFALAAFAAPEERWCRFVSNGFHRLVAAGFPAPIPGWLTLQVIRLTARVTANGSPFRLVARCPGPLPGLPPPS